MGLRELLLAVDTFGLISSDTGFESGRLKSERALRIDFADPGLVDVVGGKGAGVFEEEAWLCNGVSCKREVVCCGDRKGSGLTTGGDSSFKAARILRLCAGCDEDEACDREGPLPPGREEELDPPCWKRDRVPWGPGIGSPYNCISSPCLRIGIE
jgi:hypothetical protein